MKIAIINTEFLKNEIEKHIQIFKKDHQFKTFIYKDIKDVLEIIPAISEDYDAFFINGEITLNLIKKFFVDFKKPTICFNGDVVEYYHAILDVNINQRIPFNRIMIDHLSEDIQGDFTHFSNSNFLFEINEAYTQHIRSLPVEGLLQMRWQMVKKIKKLWSTKQFDIVITRFSTIMKELAEVNINAKFVYPHKYYIQMMVEQLIDKAHIYSFNKTLPAIILITLKQDKTVSAENKELADASLKKEILEFRKIHMDSFAVQEIENGYELLTDEKYVNKITNNYTICKLSQHLKQYLHNKVQIGYGIGSNINQATINAISAHRESQLSPCCLSYAKDVGLNLIGPLGSQNNITIPTTPDKKTTEIAAESGLSPITLKRVFSAIKLLDSNVVTAKEIADKLGVTVRTTNRFLSKLEESGNIEVYGYSQSNKRGRPYKLYKINE